MSKKPTYITAILTQEEKWIVAEDATTHVTTQGKTMDEAISNLREAVELYVEELGTNIFPSMPPRVTLTTVEL